MMKSKLVKAIMLGMCVSVLSTGVVFAESSFCQVGESVSQQSNDEDSLTLKQKEIDQYVFDEYAKEIQEKGIIVTYTGVVDNFVEIGISPYNVTNAKYLYKIFGSELVKIVEGEEISLMSTSLIAPDATVSSPTTEVDEKILAKQQEVDTYLFEEHKDEIASKGIYVNYTAPSDGFIEIGISPYSQENADYLYEALGEDVIKVVEGTQAVTMDNLTYNPNIAESGIVVQDNIVKHTSPIMILGFIAGGAVLLGGIVILTLKLRATRK